MGETCEKSEQKIIIAARLKFLFEDISRVCNTVSLCPFTCRCSAYRSSLPTKASRVTITLALMHGPLILIPLSLANFTALRFHPTLRFASLSYRFVSDTDFTRCSAELSACEKKEKKEKKRNDSSVSFLST